MKSEANTKMTTVNRPKNVLVKLNRDTKAEQYMFSTRYMFVLYNIWLAYCEKRSVLLATIAIEETSVKINSHQTLTKILITQKRISSYIIN